MTGLDNSCYEYAPNKALLADINFTVFICGQLTWSKGIMGK